jgi:hypothetical protein
MNTADQARRKSLPSRMSEGICKGCGAEIYWILTTQGKRMIVDRRRRTVITPEGFTVQGYEPHWATCPEADRFKKRRGISP